jgi:hypothetical protein
MNHIHLESQPEAVRHFVLTLSLPPDGAVLEFGGEPVACVMPPPKNTNGAPGDLHNWTEADNTRRCELIDRKYAGSLTSREAEELTELQQQMLRYRDRVAPLPLEDARRLHQDLLAKAHHGPTPP